MASPVRINGVDIPDFLFIQNIVWIALVVVVAWPVTALNVYRLYLRSNVKKAKFQNLRLYWTHIVACTLLTSGIGIDATHIFFDRSYWLREFCVSEFVVVAVNISIFYFFSHIETFIAAERGRLSIPEWLPTMKLRWMVVNTIVANICLFIRIGTMRQFLAGIMHQFEALQLLVLGPVLLYISWKVARQLEELYENSPASSGNILKNIRRFRMFAFLSSLVMIFFGVLFTESYWMFWSRDPSLTVADRERGLGRVRDLNDPIRFNYVLWFTIPALFYLFWIFWVDKDPPPVSSAPSPTPSKTPNSTDNAKPTRQKRSSEETPKTSRYTTSRDRGVSWGATYPTGQRRISNQSNRRWSSDTAAAPASPASNASTATADTGSMLSRLTRMGSWKSERRLVSLRPGGSTKKLDSIVSHVYDNSRLDREATIGNSGAMCRSPPSVAMFAVPTIDDDGDDDAGATERGSISGGQGEARSEGDLESGSATATPGGRSLESESAASNFSEDQLHVVIEDATIDTDTGRGSGSGTDSGSGTNSGNGTGIDKNSRAPS